MSPFEIYLRTGRIVPRAEVKINYWHSEETGEFTFRNTGKYWGPGEGDEQYGDGGSDDGRSRRNGRRFDGFNGGRSGGGGASGSWDAPKPKPKPKQPPNGQQATAPGAVRTTVQSPVRTPQSPRLSTSVRKNGYTYQIDDLQRSHDISGDLQNGPPGERSRRTQLQAGGTDRRPTDDGGHYIASRFNGPRDAFNHFAQDRNFNRGAYREMEGVWGREIAAGRKVRVRIVPEYRGDSQRPSSLRVIWTIAGKRRVRIFPNEPSGGRNGH